MTEDALFPRYIPRPEEEQVRAQVSRVQDDRISRVILLYGPGGVGKTCLVRELARVGGPDETTIWIDPVDVDDPEYWALSNLELAIANRLDPECRYFQPYFEYLSRLPRFTRAPISHATIVSHLGRVKRVFLQCYQEFVDGTGKTVVIIFDTVEAIRSTYLLVTLTQWMKALPGTLFIMSGRPSPEQGDQSDPIRRELDDQHQSIPITTIHLGEFSRAAALAYFEHSIVASELSSDEKAKLVLLTRGHPLWLAFTVGYLRERGMPPEVAEPLESIEQHLPFGRQMTPHGQAQREEFLRHLVASYREADFWHEAIKRLAVVRQSVSEIVWHELMADRPLPAGVPDLHHAWQLLLGIPWIRPVANRRSVALHDAVAEELARRILPVHDLGKQWSIALWERAATIYARLTAAPAAELKQELDAIDELLLVLAAKFEEDVEKPLGRERDLIQKVGYLDARKRELDQLMVTGLFYQLLCDFAAGCRKFLDLFTQAISQNDVLFQELLAFEMERYLPGEVHYVIGDVIGDVIADFRTWLCSARPELYLEIGLIIADYLLRSEQPEPAMSLLNSLPFDTTEHVQRYRISVLRGNASMRMPGRVKDGLQHFQHALAEATAVTSPDRQHLIARAYKELGFYYRNRGMWRDADDAYMRARESISIALSAGASSEDRDEIASIQTNWAYVKGLLGSTIDATNLVESAIQLRQRIGSQQEQGLSWSVCGEVYRYTRRYEKALNAYQEAEDIFLGLRNWPWLGVVYQEQAICLFQAAQDDVALTSHQDPVTQARRLIRFALDICRDQNVRGYPSALNRAGRIFGQDDFAVGLAYLEEGIEWARRLSDGWFWFANLIEYAELSYRAWIQTAEQGYIDNIAAKADEISAANSELQFPDLFGRWLLLQGGTDIRTWLKSNDPDMLDSALGHYVSGFALLAQGFFASSGTNLIPHHFREFGTLFTLLPAEIQASWIEKFRAAWSGLDNGSMILLARLEELYLSVYFMAARLTRYQPHGLGLIEAIRPTPAPSQSSPAVAVIVQSERRHRANH